VGLASYLRYRSGRYAVYDVKAMIFKE
jgi:hypothetical protein